MPNQWAALALAAVVTLCSASALAKPPVAGADSSPDAAETGWKERRTGWIVAGGGAAVLGGSIALFSLAWSEHENLRGKDPPLSADLRRIDVYNGIGTGLAVVGVAALGTGLTLVLLAPERRAEPTLKVSVGPSQLSLDGVF